MSSEEENKKILVKAEIIDKGYKIEDFTNYIKRTKNQEEITLETWTIQEIASIIKDFINKKKSNTFLYIIYSRRCFIFYIMVIALK